MYSSTLLLLSSIVATVYFANSHVSPSLAASATPYIVTFLSPLLLYIVTTHLYLHFISNSSTSMQLPCQLLVLLPLYLLSSLSYSSTLLLLSCTHTSSATPLHTHATPLSAASATPSIATLLPQLLLYTDTSQLYQHIISNSSTYMQLPCQLPVLLLL